VGFVGAGINIAFFVHITASLFTPRRHKAIPFSIVVVFFAAWHFYAFLEAIRYGLPWQILAVALIPMLPAFVIVWLQYDSWKLGSKNLLFKNRD